MCFDCCMTYSEKRCDILRVYRGIPEDELHEAALNLTEKAIKERV